MEMRANTFQQTGGMAGMDSQQQFCLKWNSFGSNLAAAFSNLFKSESLADVTLFCEGVTFKAHKLILAACSKHLADLFETAPLHQNLLVILDGTSAANMSALLEFMYKGEVHVSQDALSSFLKAAECLQVKGLSIEHEKLAVAHSQQQTSMECPPESPTVRSKAQQGKVGKEEADGNQHHNHPVSSPSSYSPVMSPYMHPHHYRQYEQRLPASGSVYDSPRKRHLPSPSELLQESVRASVLRDGSKGRPASPPGGSGPMSLAYRPSSSSSSSIPPGSQPEADAPPEHRYEPDAGVGAATTTFDRSNDENNIGGTDHRANSTDPASPEDLRMKMEPPVQEEPLSSTVGGSNGTVAQPLQYDNERDKEIISASMWNSVQGKLGKAGSVTTPDGKKLKCPFCERLYGYETNLRAHIRQRHQGIRVPCPFCSRTFTRNNTVRRHIAREHKAELSLKAFQQTQQVHNHTQ